MCQSGGYKNLAASSGFLSSILYSFLCFTKKFYCPRPWCALLFLLPEFDQNIMDKYLMVRAPPSVDF